jgi:hypothetical protein
VRGGPERHGRGGQPLRRRCRRLSDTAHRRGVRRQRSGDDVRVGAAEPTL